MDAEMKAKIIVAAIFFAIIIAVRYISYMAKVDKIEKKKTNKKGKEVAIIEVQYLYFKYKIVRERLYNNKFAILFSVINAFIICCTFIFISIIPLHFMFQVLIGFVMLMGLIYSIYGIVGNILSKRGYKDEL